MNLRKDQNLKTLQNICLTNNIPFVSFRHPEKKTIHTLLQTKTYPKAFESLSELNTIKGFVITPFFNSNLHSAFVLEPDIIFENQNIELKLLSGLNQIKFPDSLKFLDQQSSYVASKDEFIQQVKNIQQVIKTGDIRKAVISRIHKEPKSEFFDTPCLFQKLCDKYVNAFVYLFQIPGAGCWIGATPEPLLLINDDIAETISLAGTQKLENNVSEEIHWPEKFIEEQAFVTNYIENVLLTFGVKTYQKIGPFSQSAGNLIHLKTKFLFKSKALQNSLGEFVDLLYPTPSICGLPRNNTFDILANIEAHDREYYTGLLGPVNMNEETNLFVNLRCLKVLKTELALFLGAGITTGSVPDDEWEETNQKKMTLLSVIQN